MPSPDEIRELLSEDLYSLAKAAKLYPGGPRHVSQMHRYRLSTSRPALVCVFAGGKWMTSVPSMERHVVALTQHAVNLDGPIKIGRDDVDRLAKAADAELAEAGF